MSTASDYNGSGHTKRSVDKQVLKDNSNSKNARMFQPAVQAQNSSSSLGHKRVKSQGKGLLISD